MRHPAGWLCQRNLIPVLAVVFAATAALLSFQLLALHLGESAGPAWFDVGCGEDSALGSDCAAVLASPYSYWPPKLENEPKNTPHIPVAFLGLVYYSMLSIWLVGVGRVSYDRRRWHLLPVILTALGLVGSANFVAIMFTKLGEWCFWCMVTHVLNVLVAACLVLMWPRRATTSAESTPDRGAARNPTVVSHPSGRLAFMTLVAAILVSFGQMQFLGRTLRTKQAIALKTGFDECVATMKQLSAGGEPLLAMWLRAETRTIAVRNDDPVRWQDSTVKSPLEAVVFSDFECPSCRRLARFLEEDVQPLFDGHLTLVFKHYPLNRQCNPATTTKKHKHACQGATLAEAARALGGPEAFWKAHDYIFAHQSELKSGRLSPAEVAASAGLDAHRFEKAVGSGAALERIAQDASQGRGYGVHGTPALFVSGREVRIPARGDIRFWDKLADHYWRGRNEPRPASTLLATPRQTGYTSRTTPAATE